MGIVRTGSMNGLNQRGESYTKVNSEGAKKAVSVERDLYRLCGRRLDGEGNQILQASCDTAYEDFNLFPEQLRKFFIIRLFAGQ